MADPTPADMVRLLVNDPAPEAGDFQTETVFSDTEVANYLALESGNVKRAAAQAIDTIADNEALASKVITDHQLSTDGAKLADALRKRATALRAQADREDDLADDGAYFQIVAPPRRHRHGPELTGGFWV